MTPDMEERLAELERLAKAVTPRRWRPFVRAESNTFAVMAGFSLEREVIPWTGLDGSDTADTPKKREALARFIAAANPSTILALLSERRKMVEALSVFGRAVDDGPGGNTEGVPDETPVRMFFADPEFDGEDTLLGEPFMRAFRTAAALSGSREHAD